MPVRRLPIFLAVGNIFRVQLHLSATQLDDLGSRVVWGLQLPIKRTGAYLRRASFPPGKHESNQYASEWEGDDHKQVHLITLSSGNGPGWVCRVSCTEVILQLGNWRSIFDGGVSHTVSEF